MVALPLLLAAHHDNRALAIQAGVRFDKARDAYQPFGGIPDNGAVAESRAARHQSQRAFDSYLLGNEGYHRNELEKASRSFLQATILQPEDFQSRFMLAVCQLRLRQYREASVELTRCLDQRPGHFWGHLLRSQARMELRSFDAAEQDINAALASANADDTRYAVLATRGLLRSLQDRYAEAIDDLRGAIALQPHRYYAMLSLARVHQKQKAYSTSTEYFEQAIRLAAPAPVVAECWAESSRNRFLIGDYAGAIDRAESALRAWPGYATAYELRALALVELKSYEEAAQSFEDYIAHGGKADVAYFRGRGHLRVCRGDYLGARDDYTRALDLHADPEVFLHRGWAYYFADAWKPAQNDFDEALRQRPPPTDASIGRGLTHMMQGHYREAVADAEQALHCPPNTPEMTHNLACLFALASVHPEVCASVAAQHCDRACALLGQALVLVPLESRRRFWRERIVPDKALDSIRHHPAFQALEPAG
jgi:tetratricopeptide (TPR) repeat protein